MYNVLYLFYLSDFSSFFSQQNLKERKMATSHILSAIEPLGTNANGGANNGATTHNKSPDLIDRNLHVSLDDRDLWLRFQNLTNEMIVTKNGR